MLRAALRSSPGQRLSRGSRGFDSEVSDDGRSDVSTEPVSDCESDQDVKMVRVMEAVSKPSFTLPPRAPALPDVHIVPGMPGIPGMPAVPVPGWAGDALPADHGVDGEPSAAEQHFKFWCKQCPARFTHVNLLSRHNNEEHPVTKPYPCPGCGRGYVIKEVMESHFRMVHCDERPFPCGQCEKVFSRQEYLQTHSRVHTGFKPYGCGDCGRSFAWKSCYDIHRRTHTGERPYLCITCLKDFATANTLKLHEMIHTESFPFPCDRCDSRFRVRRRLRQHLEFHERTKDIFGDDQDQNESRGEETMDGSQQEELQRAVEALEAQQPQQAPDEQLAAAV